MSSIRVFWAKVLPHIPYIIRHDFWRKVFALIFACLLTWYAYQNVKSRMELVRVNIRNVPVRFVPLEEGVTLIPRDVSADVTLEVPKEQKTLKNTDFYLECPVTKYQVETDMPVELRLDMVRSNIVFDELHVLAVNPDMIPLNIDIMDTKDVPVHPVSDSAEVMEGYQASLIQPEKPVTIRGPKKLLDTIEYLETEKIPLANVTKSFTRQVDPVSPYGRNIEILSGKVKVEVRVEKNKPRAFDGIPVQVLFGRTGANNLIISKIQPESVTVLVDSVPDISQTQIHPFLDLSDVTRPGVYTVDIKCWSDNDRIKVVEVIPAQATVTLEPVVAPASK
jgi:YbbR domain-containing protein